VLHPPVEPGQYTSLRYTEHLELEGIAPSIGTVGDAYNNALMES
jgi:transposase InsO family protein